MNIRILQKALLLTLVGFLCSAKMVSAGESLNPELEYKPQFQKRVNKTMNEGLGYYQAEKTTISIFDFKQALKRQEYPFVVEDLVNNSNYYEVFTIDETAMLEALNSKQVHLKITATIELSLTTIIPLSEGALGSYVWEGIGREGSGDMAVLTFIDGKYYGSIWKNHKMHRINPLEKGTYLITDLQAEKEYGNEGINADEGAINYACSKYCDFEAKPIDREYKAENLDPISSEPANESGTNENETQMVTFYNDGAVEYFGSKEVVENKIAQYINETNVAFSNSGVNATLVSVEVSYKNTNSRYNAANRRNELCADVAATFGTAIKKGGNGNDKDDDVGCGNAERYGEGNNGSNIVACPSGAEQRFTFTHELGHVWDANHDQGSDSSCAPNCGYINCSQDWQTVMSKADCMAREDRILYYSNPSAWYDGYPTGTSSTNNVVRMNQLVYNIANYNGGSNAPNHCPNISDEGDVETLLASYFEYDMDGWVSSGVDCERQDNHAYERDYAIRIRDNSETSSMYTKSTYDLTAYNKMEVLFYFYSKDMEDGEEVKLDFFNGNNWETVWTIECGDDFSGNGYFEAYKTFTNNNRNFPTNAKFKFKSRGENNDHRIYIDAITIKGHLASNAKQRTSKSKGIEKINRIIVKAKDD